MRRWVSLLAIVAVLAACDAGAPVDTGIAAESRTDDAAMGGLATEMVEPAVVVAEPSMVMDAPVTSPEPSPEPAFGTGLVRAGVLTAGDIDDGLNIAAFGRALSRMRAQADLPTADFAAPVLARLTGPDGAPATRQRVTLRLPGAAEAFWDGYSGVDGVITVFPGLFGAGHPGQVEMRVFPAGQGEPVVQTLATGGTRTTVAVPFGAVEPGFLDLAFVVDATGSMGDELEWLTRDLNSIVTQARRGYGGLDIRYGLIVYRDQGDEYVVRAYDFTGSASTMRQQLRAQVADAGGDYPEAAADALAAGVGLSWRRGQGERLMFHVADAPPHAQDAGRYLGAAQAAARAGVQIFGLGASGVGAEAEGLMRQAALMTGGRYLFLTDDSGVGLAHEEPRVSCYQVTELRDLMVRVIRSEITGRREEAAPGDVVRTVGSYQGGVCRD